MVDYIILFFAFMAEYALIDSGQIPIAIVVGIVILFWFFGDMADSTQNNADNTTTTSGTQTPPANTTTTTTTKKPATTTTKTTTKKKPGTTTKTTTKKKPGTTTKTTTRKKPSTTGTKGTTGRKDPGDEATGAALGDTGPGEMSSETGAKVDTTPATLEETIELANQGDLEAMYALGCHYREQNDLGNQRTWFVKAAEGGYERAYIPAAGAMGLSAYCTRRAGAISDSIVSYLDKALDWVELARKNGTETNIENELIRERAICAYEASLQEGSKITQKKAIQYLRAAHKLPGTSPEVEYYLAKALFLSGDMSATSAKTCHKLLRGCVNYTEEDLPGVDLGYIDAMLGMCYLAGKGCAVDDTAAYECFVRAGQKGFDSSDMLGYFSKNPSGTYSFSIPLENRSELF